MEYRDYYKILGVARGASADEIKRAYRKLARKFHPDVSKEKNAEARFKEVQEAYEVLKDPEKRAAYDQLGPDFQSGQQFRPPPGWGSNFEFSGARGGRGGRRAGADPGFSDFFSSLFGAHSPFGEFDGGGADFRSRGEDHRARLELTLEEAYRGGSREFRLQHPEVTGDGHVALKDRTLRVQLPAGVTQGQVIRLAGQGAAGAGGGRAGDLLLEVAIAPHPLFQLDGRDVTLELPVAPWEAALGATVSTPTLGGAVELRIPAGARAGQKLRLRGRGLPGEPPGDQYVALRIVLPPADTARARELYEQLSRELPFDPRAELGGR
ncbi:MAG TPA: DnaJ C-terminal domain-containing protein [Steroidobacteraceae bacterium]|nr:DnaJ C-terminal domain-containing protein [Steroidobacteraceae bacterium]